MKKFIIILYLLILCIYCNAQKCVRVIDGDTFITVIESTGEYINVRLAHVDSPEISQPMGKESKQYLQRLILNKRIELIILGIDKYSRRICQVNLKGVNINKTLVQNGMAFVYSQYCKDPTLYESQAIARMFCLGVWKQKNIIYPWVYRNTNYKKA